MILLGASTISAGIGAFVASTMTNENDARWWFLAAGFCLVAAVFTWLSYFVVHPAFVKAEARRAITLKQARKTKAEARSPTGLAVHAALYGTEERPDDWAGVTEYVQAQIADGQLDFMVENELLGGDPAGGLPKVLRISYQTRWMHEAKKEEFAEHTRVVLPAAR